MRQNSYLSTSFCIEMRKYEKYRNLLTFDGLSKNVKNTILTYDKHVLGFREICKKLLSKSFL